MPQQIELEGFINVKIPSRIKSRNFIPWKVWKRQWIVVERSQMTGNGVELVIGRNSPTVLQVLTEDIICRAESRTQRFAFGIFPAENKRRARVFLSGKSETDSHKWISKIRKLLKPPLLPVEENEFSVSIIDNFFTKTAGLSGLYGTMKITPRQVLLVDPCTSKHKAEWSWTDLSQFHLTSTIVEEDKGHVCTIVTSRSFLGGAGLIHLFCTEGLALVRKLKFTARASKLASSADGDFSVSPRHITFSCNFVEKPITIYPSQFPFTSSSRCRRDFSNSKSLISTRYLSRSEDNMATTLRQLESKKCSFLDDGENCLDFFHLQTFQLDKFRYSFSDHFMAKMNVASGIISAGLGLILSTPGGSQEDSESLSEYLKLQNDDPEDALSMFHFTKATSKFGPPRRKSEISIASGVYEEIEDIPTSILNFETENETKYPPPLPPRKHCLKNLEEKENILSFSETVQPSSALPLSCLLDSGNYPLSNMAVSKELSTGTEEYHYLPMVPRWKFSKSKSTTDLINESKDDQNYMVMARLRTN